MGPEELSSEIVPRAFDFKSDCLDKDGKAGESGQIPSGIGSSSSSEG